MLPGNMKVPSGGPNIGMPQQLLDSMQVHAGFQEMGRKRVPE
jgi:hypothetical protein